MPVAAADHGVAAHGTAPRAFERNCTRRIAVLDARPFGSDAQHGFGHDLADVSWELRLP